MTPPKSVPLVPIADEDDLPRALVPAAWPRPVGYANGMTALEWALNSWHIPFVTPSAQARADEQYRSKRLKLEFTRLADLAATYRQIDSAAGADLLRQLDPTRLPGR